MPLTMKELEAQSHAPPPCPLCGRPLVAPTAHHLVPRARGGKATTRICRDCHSAIHATFSNEELERDYGSIAQLLAHPRFARTIDFIAKQDGKVRTRRPKNERRRR